MARSHLIEAGTAAGGTVVTLIHEIGTDGLFALLRVLEGEGRERAEAYYRHCRDGDLALAVAQTDVKGDRSKAPHQQADPDLYVRVVDRSDEGIVVRGAKCHTTSSANGDEIIVFPTRAMGPDDADYAVSFAVPANTEGLSLYVSGLRRWGRRPRRLRPPGVLEAQAAGDPDRLRRRVRALGAGVPLPGAREGRCPGPHLRRVPPLHGGVLQAPAGRRLRRRRRPDRRDERRHEGGPHPGQAHPPGGLCRDGPGPHRGRRPALPHRRARHRLPGPHDHEHGQVHLRLRLLQGGRMAAGHRRRPAGHRPVRRRLGRTARSGPSWRSTTRAPPRPPSAWP